MFEIHPEVQQAQKNGRPVVALETSVFAQGLPNPENRQVADQMSQAVREAGAVPAVLFVKDGSMTVAAYLKSVDQDLTVTGFKHVMLG